VVAIDCCEILHKLQIPAEDDHDDGEFLNVPDGSLDPGWLRYRILVGTAMLPAV
jgi:hypothetical protein